MDNEWTLSRAPVDFLQQLLGTEGEQLRLALDHIPETWPPWPATNSPAQGLPLPVVQAELTAIP
ncbi:hypothetical protein [Parafrankia sp. BMG5.11]|uniref:hypothetical protein n=1 Tax=Parafrankia sp. BMG5.11 TaxID=222540 RepID=UPI00103DFACB|nr:hypothetical protein [Parafrankia sp. BMG5.11]TCJ37790.1 hypothetical protein E0504_17135 [Parafrankia sp. BMG5.11]